METKIKIGKELFEVRECQRKRTDKKYLAPISNGFVCLYQNDVYEQWCGVNFAKERTVS